ncbi:MAG: hypothetical protein GY868_07505 [Deltaproteobacteria bacterium]|nr:hypothetical protein [Deltaproteobacteria bacterium]
MQLALFDENNVLENTFRKNLETLDLDSARETLKLLDTVGDPQGTAPDKIAALRTLQAEPALTDRNNRKALGTLYLNLDSLPYLAPLHNDLHALKTGFLRTIAGLISTDDHGYICPGLHAAEVLCRTEQYDRTVDTALSAIRRHGEQAFLRQLIGWAWHKLGNALSSRENLGLALFFNALECRECFLPPGDFTELLQDLKHQHTNPDMARIFLPQELWAEETIGIQTKEAYLLCLREQIDNTPEPSGLGTALRGLLFNRLLYLAEALRRTRADHNEMVRLRGRMKKLDPDRFKEYIEIITGR